MVVVSVDIGFKEHANSKLFVVPCQTISACGAWQNAQDCEIMSVVIPETDVENLSVIANTRSPANGANFPGTQGRSTATLGLTLPAGTGKMVFLQGIQVPTSGSLGMMCHLSPDGSYGAGALYIDFWGDDMMVVLIGAGSGNQKYIRVTSYRQKYAGRIVDLTFVLGDSDTISVYSDGVSQEYVTGTTGDAPPSWNGVINANYLDVGCFGNGDSPYTGSIRGVAIANTAATAEQIREIHRTGVYPADWYVAGGAGVPSVDTWGSLSYSGFLSSSTGFSGKGVAVDSVCEAWQLGANKIRKGQFFRYKGTWTVGSDGTLSYALATQRYASTGGAELPYTAGVHEVDVLVEAHSTVDSGYLVIFTIGNASVTFSGTVTPVGLVFATDPHQIGSGSIWRDTSGANHDLVLAPAVTWLSPAPVAPRTNIWKVEKSLPAFVLTGLSTISLRAGTIIEYLGSSYYFPVDTAVSVPSHVAGTDYAIYVTATGQLIASSNFTAPVGYTTSNTAKLGGYHYGPGALATAQAGGDTTPQIVSTSIWDLKYRPACADPRGMSKTPFGWVMLYPLNTTPHLLGPSAYNATIADGASLPTIPPLFGGDGSATYSDFSRFVADELLGAFGLRLLTPGERAIAAYGVTEGTSRGTDPVVTLCDAPRTSKYMYQAAGNMWEWMTGQTDNPSGTFAWRAAPASRGSVYHVTMRTPIGGGLWSDGSASGSCCSGWHVSPWVSGSDIGARGCCGHIENL